MNNKKHLLSFLAAGALAAGSAQAAVIATWSLDSDLTNTSADVNIATAADATPSSLSTIGFAGNDFGGWEFDGLGGTVTFDLTASAGYEISITGFSFNVNNVQNQSTSYTIDVDGSEVVASSSGNAQAVTHSFAATTAAETVSIVMNWSGASWPDQELQDFNVDGTVNLVPEPSSYAFLAGLAGLGLVLARRRRS
jgi:hypothetical protein